MTIRIGTSGFSYREWKGRFYPKDLPAAQMLAHYASRIHTVEINSTFYRRPEPAQLTSWAASTPSSFRFVFKASRYFSAGPGLKNAQKPLAEFFSILSTTGDKLGAVLVQFPPHLKSDLALLRDFIAAIPRGRHVALDLRDASWRTDAVLAAMRDAGVAWCATEADEEQLELVTTARWAYVRLRRSRYTSRDFGAFAERIKKAGIDEGYVIFKHDETGRAACNAESLQRLLE